MLSSMQLVQPREELKDMALWIASRGRTSYRPTLGFLTNLEHASMAGRQCLIPGFICAVLNNSFRFHQVHTGGLESRGLL
jgi:hypothetical protein